MVQIVKSQILCKNRVNEVKIGHLPCVYIRLVCRSGHPISIYQVRLNGLDALSIGEKFGPATEYLLYKSTERILFGSGLRLSRPIAKSKSNRMQKVGGDKPDASYSYLTDLATPRSVMMSRDGGLNVGGVNIARGKLDDALRNLSAIKDPNGSELYEELFYRGTEDGGAQKQRAKPPPVGVPTDEVFILNR